MRIRTKITLRGFKPNARGAGHVLGELETAVMELLWREAGLTVNQWRNGCSSAARSRTLVCA